jgi:colanic acid/amylovoran biosynthesis glycosyltransferase
MKKKKLYFFTAEFPYGKHGETFIENEIPIQANYFDEIIIFPLSSKISQKRAMPANATVVEALNNRPGLHSKQLFFSNIGLIFSILFREFLNCPNKLFFIKKSFHFNSLLVRAIHDAGYIEAATALPDKNAVFYSFWMNDWALALAVLKHKKKISEFVFRCAGFDTYDERYEGHYLPFRYTIYKSTSAIYPSSKMSENYIKDKNMFPEKAQVSYLGTNDYGNNPFDASAVFTVVSCSSLVPLKRVHLIIELLKQVHFEVQWIHFGGGELEEELKTMASRVLPSNVRYEFKGSVNNSSILEFYKKTSINLFITTSETEGLPVSIQEAISFGIPVMATAVGGIPEIVNDTTGFLIDENFKMEDAAQLILQFKVSNKNASAYREGVRQFWKQHFSAEKNYKSFYEMLLP